MLDPGIGRRLVRLGHLGPLPSASSPWPRHSSFKSSTMPGTSAATSTVSQFCLLGVKSVAAWAPQIGVLTNSRAFPSKRPRTLHALSTYSPSLGGQEGRVDFVLDLLAPASDHRHRNRPPLSPQAAAHYCGILQHRVGSPRKLVSTDAVGPRFRFDSEPGAVNVLHVVTLTSSRPCIPSTLDLKGSASKPGHHINIDMTKNAPRLWPEKPPLVIPAHDYAHCRVVIPRGPLHGWHGP